MSYVHYLNVKEGDCSIIEHLPRRVSVIDVCNAKSPDFTGIGHMHRANYGQKNHPVNPIEYLQSRGVRGIPLYIQTHPDMDHMDGIKALFAAFSPTYFWDTNNKKEREYVVSEPGQRPPTVHA